MIASVMQPYFLPYIGYWQLIEASSCFYIFDDVNYIKKGFIDRNTIYTKQGFSYFKLRISKASQNKLINQHELASPPTELLDLFYNAYNDRPFFREAVIHVEEILAFPERNLALFVENSINVICRYLEIKTPILRSSEVRGEGKGKDKIIPIVKFANAETYLNMEGGRGLYNEQKFEESGLNLRFFKPQIPAEIVETPYDTSHVSIIDLMTRIERGRLCEIARLGSVAQ